MRGPSHCCRGASTNNSGENTETRIMIFSSGFPITYLIIDFYETWTSENRNISGSVNSFNYHLRLM